MLGKITFASCLIAVSAVFSSITVTFPERGISFQIRGSSSIAAKDLPSPNSLGITYMDVKTDKPNHSCICSFEGTEKEWHYMCTNTADCMAPKWKPIQDYSVTATPNQQQIIIKYIDGPTIRSTVPPLKVTVVSCKKMT
jgi:hypothetical protein